MAREQYCHFCSEPITESRPSTTVMVDNVERPYHVTCLDQERAVQQAAAEATE